MSSRSNKASQIRIFKGREEKSLPKLDTGDVAFSGSGPITYAEQSYSLQTFTMRQRWITMSLADAFFGSIGACSFKRAKIGGIGAVTAFGLTAIAGIT